MANKILQIDLQNDITPQIGSYDNTGGVAPNNWSSEDGVYSLGPTNGQGTTPYYWFTSTREVTDFDLCWEDYQDQNQTTPQYHLEIGDSAGNVVLSAYRQYGNYSIGPVNVGDLAYQTWHKILVEVRKASANSSIVTAYVDGKKVATGTSDTLLTSAKIALLGHVPNVYRWQNAGQRLRYVTIYDRSYTSKGINLDGMMTIIRGLISKLITKLSTVAFTGSYNDLSDKPTISTVNNGTLTIQQNGTTVDSFSANSSTNKTANIQCVDLSSNQTIGGQKIFSNGAIGVGRDLHHFATSPYGKNTPPANTSYQYVWFDGNTASQGLANSWYGGYLEQRIYTDGSAQGRWFIRDTSESGLGIELFVNGSDKQFRPQGNNITDLGTSTNKWKSFNGINPGALSLPGDAYIDIDTTNYAWGSNFTFTPDYDGYCFLSVGLSSNSRVISLKSGRGEYYFSNQTNIFRFTFPVYKGKLVTILTASSGTESVIPTIRVFSCQGNV